ncbi:tripartite motif-containing protein 66-like [Gouania willdenowi]|uniref:Tripartite motif-containing protein 66-like n=1 Tax=Gouania willdenowi TaxID=441366 RepID=A0A8C5E5M9_GOUWI|nr:tripartite motif-containing protein 66-like [Gouania willdenowi]
MAEPPCSRHGNAPQRQSTLLPRVAKWGARLALKTMSPKTSLKQATTEEESNLKPNSCVFCEKEKRINWCYNRRFKGTSTSSKKWKKRPNNDVKALLKKLRIPPEAQRILGNSCIALVSLERLNFKSILPSSLQPVVCLVRLQCPTQAERYNKTVTNLPEQIGLGQQSESSPQSKPEECSDISQTETETKATSESYSSDICPPEEPEQALCFDSESSLHQPFILFDSESDHIKTDSETFYLDPDPDQTLVIELDPDAGAGQARCRLIQSESKAKHETVVVQMDDSEDKKTALCCLQNKSETEAETKESEDFCAVCLNGGHLLCCDRCPKVYHLVCHIPPLIGCPTGDWVCTLCRTDQDPVEAYDCEKIPSCDGFKVPYTLCSQDQRRCEKLTLLLYCHVLSAPFHEPVSPWAQNYYQIIKKPIDLSVIRKKLDRSKTLHYFTAEQFVNDVLLMFKNCATFNYPDSEVAQAGRNLEVFFLNKLREIFPGQTFPSASQDKTNKARLQWFCKKKKECHRKKKVMFHGRNYFLKL